MMELHVILSPDIPALPVRTYLRQTQHISNSQWRRIKNSGTFRLNGEAVNLTQSTVHTGDILTFESEKHESPIEPQDLPLDIRYEDAALLVIHKPAGQVVHPLRPEPTGTVGNAVLGYYRRTEQVHGFHPVHRLDRMTTGLVLIAKEPQVQHQLTKKGLKAFHREYLALIRGHLEPPAGTIDLPIGFAPDSFIRHMVTDTGKPARTHYETVRTGIFRNESFMGELSLLHLRLDTGRTHQIRVHLAHLGHPLLGDDLYGGDMGLIDRQALHACSLTFIHPMTGETIHIADPVPNDMQQIIDGLCDIPFFLDAAEKS